MDEGGRNDRPAASDVHGTHSRGNSVAIHYFALWPHAGTGRCDRDGARRRGAAELGKTARVRLPSSNLLGPCFGASSRSQRGD
ncbi:hypothetical protein K0M31_013898 [Melipona bicolor]|uniref:Uncharacterized protein n=1 Tax=Melipona bicolor TaxID=60889 RepID=A0AA40G868_9HYME|nr:hypothetical protein K0M31_013898 [Melipona bicolor]